MLGFLSRTEVDGRFPRRTALTVANFSLLELSGTPVHDFGARPVERVESEEALNFREAGIGQPGAEQLD
jgi:hypothetical protein